jgi:diguanylate cyclase (GGDEF)-like protein
MTRDSSRRRSGLSPRPQEGERPRARLRPGLAAAWRFGLLLAGALQCASPAAASDLSVAVDRLVVQGFEDPAGATAALHALQARTPPTPENTRAILVGLGLVAADSHLDRDAKAVATQLTALAATVGPIAAADAHLVNADLEFEGRQEENGNVEARAAVAAYSPFCESRDAALAARCDRYNWFYALLFAGYGAHGERNSAAAAIYLHMALDAALQAGNRTLEIKATAILASLAQADNDPELADRFLAQAHALAEQEGDPAMKSFVASFTGDVLGQRERYEQSLAAYLGAIEIAHVAGLHRREAQVELDLSSAQLSLDHPTEALASLGRAQAFLATHNEPALERQRLHDQAIALLALGRVAEGRAKLREALARYDRETGPNARIQALRDLGPALAKSGDRDGALELFTREQQLLQAKSDGRYERDMLEVQKLIKDENDRQQARRLQQWGSAAAACILLALAIAFVARRQAERNRLLARRNDALRVQAEHDPLTGLANRAHLQPRLGEAGNAAFAGALFMIDIDHFKDINDRHGHAAGDAVLVDIARRLETVLRDHDLVVRWGGEEFLVLVDTMPVAEAIALAQRLLKAFAEQPVTIDSRAIAVSASIGFAVFPLAGGTPGHRFDQAFALVDAAMFHSKNAGRGCATCLTALDPSVPLPLATLPATLEQAAADGKASLSVYRLPRVSSGADATPEPA